jgi:hypothetical protein
MGLPMKVLAMQLIKQIKVCVEDPKTRKADATVLSQQLEFNDLYLKTAFSPINIAVLLRKQSAR